MDVRCGRCGTEYDFDDALISERGTTVQCTECGFQFKVFPAAPLAVQERWVVRSGLGAGWEREFTSLKELQWAIQRGEVGPEDLLSRGAGLPRSLASIAELEPLFRQRLVRTGGTLLGIVPEKGTDAELPPTAAVPAKRRVETKLGMPVPSIPVRPPTAAEPPLNATLPSVSPPFEAAPPPSVAGPSSLTGAAPTPDFARTLPSLTSAPPSEPAAPPSFAPAAPLPGGFTRAPGARPRILSALTTGGDDSTAPLSRAPSTQTLPGQASSAESGEVPSTEPAFGSESQRPVNLGGTLIQGSSSSPASPGGPLAQTRPEWGQRTLPSYTESRRSEPSDGAPESTRFDAPVSSQAFPMEGRAQESTTRPNASEGAALEGARPRSVTQSAATPSSVTSTSVTSNAVISSAATPNSPTQSAATPNSARALSDPRLAAASSSASRIPTSTAASSRDVTPALEEPVVLPARRGGLLWSVAALLLLGAVGLGAWSSLRSGEEPAAASVPSAEIAASAPESSATDTSQGAPPESAEVVAAPAQSAAPEETPPASEPPSRSQEPVDYRTRLAAAARAAQAGELARAQGLYEGVLREQPGNVEAQAGLAEVLQRRGKTQQAAEHYEAVLANNPSYVPALLGRGDQLWSSGDRAGALQLYQRVVDQVGTTSTYGQRAQSRIDQAASTTTPAPSDPTSEAAAAPAKDASSSPAPETELDE